MWMNPRNIMLSENRLLLHTIQKQAKLDHDITSQNNDYLEQCVLMG